MFIVVILKFNFNYFNSFFAACLPEGVLCRGRCRDEILCETSYVTEMLLMVQTPLV